VAYASVDAVEEGGSCRARGTPGQGEQATSSCGARKKIHESSFIYNCNRRSDQDGEHRRETTQPHLLFYTAVRGGNRVSQCWVEAKNNIELHLQVDGPAGAPNLQVRSTQLPVGSRWCSCGLRLKSAPSWAARHREIPFLCARAWPGFVSCTCTRSRRINIPALTRSPGIAYTGAHLVTAFFVRRQD
jgi:hypothetical protein